MGADGNVSRNDPVLAPQVGPQHQKPLLQRVQVNLVLQALLATVPVPPLPRGLSPLVLLELPMLQAVARSSSGLSCYRCRARRDRRVQ